MCALPAGEISDAAGRRACFAIVLRHTIVCDNCQCYGLLDFVDAVMPVTMTTAIRPAIRLSFAQVVTVLIEACDLPPASRSAVEARVRQLQRFGVPGRGDAPAGSRQVYGITELAMLATAFKLMAGFMNPSLAARYVAERWAELAPFVLAGAKDAMPASYLARRPIDERAITAFHGNALADMGRKGRHDERYDGALGDVAILSGESAIDLSTARGVGLFLDSRSYMPTLIKRAVGFAVATEAELAIELDRLRHGSRAG